VIEFAGRIGVDRSAAPAVVVVERERLAVGLTALAVAALPLAFSIGPANIAPVDLAAIAAIIAVLVWANLARHRWRLPYVLPVALMIVGGAFGALVGPVPSLGVTAITQDMLLFAWCSTVVNISYRAGNFRTLAAAWAYGSIGWASLVVVGVVIGSPLLTGKTATEGSRIALTFGDPNVAAYYFFISIMVIWATMQPRRHWLRWAAYSPLVVCIVLTGSNSGALALIMGATAACVLGVYARAGAIPAIAVTACVVLAAGVAAVKVTPATIQTAARGSHYAFIRDGLGRSVQTGDDHKLIVKEGLRLFVSGPLSGEGPVSTKTRLRAENAPRVKEAHSDYVAALTERGVIGFTGLLILVASLGFRALSVTSRGLSDDFAAVVPRPNALVGALAGTLAAGVVYEVLHVRHVWTLFAMIAALSIWGRR